MKTIEEVLEELESLMEVAIENFKDAPDKNSNWAGFESGRIHTCEAIRAFILEVVE